jgi:hypothetical protein
VVLLAQPRQDFASFVPDGESRELAAPQQRAIGPSAFSLFATVFCH